VQLRVKPLDESGENPCAFRARPRGRPRTRSRMFCTKGNTASHQEGRMPAHEASRGGGRTESRNGAPCKTPWSFSLGRDHRRLRRYRRKGRSQNDCARPPAIRRRVRAGFRPILSRIRSASVTRQGLQPCAHFRAIQGRSGENHCRRSRGNSRREQAKRATASRNPKRHSTKLVPQLQGRVLGRGSFCFSMLLPPRDGRGQWPFSGP